MDDIWRGSTERAAGRVTRGRLRSRHCRRLLPDTYAASELVVDERTSIRAAACYGGPTAVVTGWSACVLLGLDVARGRPPVEMSVPDRRLKRTDVRVRRQRFPDDELTEVDGVRITSALRTAFDLAAREPLVEAVVAADALARVGGFDGADLVALAARRPGHRGVRRVTAVARLLDPRSESPQETRTRLALVHGGLPAPAVQYEVRDDLGWLIARVDLAYPELRVAVEYDGHHHAEDDRRGRDIDRIDQLERAGWVVVVVTKRQLRVPHRLVARVREAMAAQTARGTR